MKPECRHRRGGRVGAAVLDDDTAVFWCPDCGALGLRLPTYHSRVDWCLPSHRSPKKRKVR